MFNLLPQHAYGENVYRNNSCGLYQRNKDVNEINEFALDRFFGTVVEMFSSDSAIEGQQLYLVEFLNILLANGFPSHKIRLKTCYQ